MSTTPFPVWHMTAIGAIALYSLPAPVAKVPLLVGIWAIAFYLLYDIGTSFYNPNILYRIMTKDVKERAKLAMGPALFTLVLAIAAILIYQKYPINNEERAAMRAALDGDEIDKA